MCYQWWCAGGVRQTSDIVKNKPEAIKMLEVPWQKHEEIEKCPEPKPKQDHLIMRLFGEYLGPFLMKRPVKVGKLFCKSEKQFDHNW